ncbi:MAG: DUF4389 domain-containing protein [Dehalococcoidia bacterium]
MATYASTFDVAQPKTYNRAQVALRLVILVVGSILAGAIGWIPGLVWLGIPVVAAVLISQRGPEKYIAEAGEGMIKWLRYIIGFYAYLLLLTDDLPSDDAANAARFDVTASGTPSVGQALLRIILIIPHAIVLGLLSIVAGLLAIIAAVMVLVQETYPAGIHDFLRGYVRWHARVLTYMGSLTDEYPPFALDTGGEGEAATATPPPASPV